MTEAVRVRDWLSELRTAAEGDNSDLFRSLVVTIADVQPNLKSQVCQLAGDYLENGETWAASFFKDPEAKEEDEVQERPKGASDGWGKRRPLPPEPAEERPALLEKLKPKEAKEPLFISPAAQPEVGEAPSLQPKEEAKQDEATSLSKLILGLGAQKREELFKAILADKAIGTALTQPLTFQHSKSPAGIPASLENALVAIDKLNIDCKYDIFHDRGCCLRTSDWAEGRCVEQYRKRCLEGSSSGPAEI